MPAISVIVPVYNVEPYLRRCVDCILAQTFTDFELILIDDESPDNCPAICDEYAQKDGRVHVIHQPNGGPSASRNAGIEWAFAHSDSQWLAFIDSDDWVHPSYLETLYRAAVGFDVQISLCQFVSVSTEADLPSEYTGKEYLTDIETLYVQNYILCMAVWCKLYKKELFEKLRFPTGKIHEDAFISHIPLFQAGKIAVSEKVLYFYFQRANSIMHASWTPTRLVDLDAHDVRLDFLMKNSSQKVIEREMIAYLSIITQQMKAISESPYRRSKYARYLRKRLRTLLKQFSEYDFIDVQDWAVYEFDKLAYPMKARADHFRKVGFRGVIDVMRHRGSKDSTKG